MFSVSSDEMNCEEVLNVLVVCVLVNLLMIITYVHMPSLTANEASKQSQYEGHFNAIIILKEHVPNP